ncbi:MAG: FecR domain-containing protein, partial [Rhodocyclaceae bacterium]|nr:FecR domain-containing protein [Rhodocyclaceae bacterium]
MATLILAMSSFAISADSTPPPSRVGRIGFIDGDVSFFADREEGWRKARMNFPVTSKNSLWTNGTSRAEVRLGASAVRLDADTILDFIAIDDVHTSLYLQRGNINIRVRAYAHRPGTDDTYRDQFRIETDSGTWTLEQSGRYRLESTQDRNETRISVYAGQASFDNGSARLKVETGKSLRLSISGGATTFSFDPASEFAFDRWAESRDLRWDEAHQRYASERIISPYMTGYEELDSHGDWIDEPEYGRLWTPRVVASGWVPYRYGAWSYVRPWGWTWIDEAPWGFAPFHYGRWVQIRARWYWAPGRFHHRPVYAPALVGWYGNGNTSVSISVGAPIGWFPLAPREHFIPTYTTSTTYIRNINYITNNTIVTAPTQYLNQGSGGTLVNQNVVVRGEPVWRSATISGGPNGRMVKPARDPMDVAQGNTQTWVPTAPPSAPTQTATGALPRPTAVAGEAPSVRRPAWVYGETPRSQVGAQTTQQPVQPTSIPVPG